VPAWEGALVYDHARRKSVYLTARTTPLETWEWDGTRWRHLFTSTNPPARYWMQAVYDRARAEVVLFGGGDPAAIYANLDDTWCFDGIDWRLRSPAVKPPARQGGGMTFDPIRRTCVLSGGLTWTAQYRWVPRNDTWEWDGSNWREMVPIAPPAMRDMRDTKATLAHSPVARRVVLAGRGMDETWELVRPCEDVGRGHAIGGPIIACTSEPILGGRLDLTFESPFGLGAMLASQTCDEVAMDVLAPLFCARGSVYPDVRSSLVLGLTGNPARLSVQLPNDPLLLGQTFCFQGLAAQATGCLRLTQGVRVRVSRAY
jgi:hypothetical protein